MGSIEEKRRQRTAFMRALYEASGGDHRCTLDPDQLAHEVGIIKADRGPLIDYLEGEDLLRVDRGANGGAFYVSIAHRGVVEVEQALQSPTAATSHFEPIATLNINNFFADATGAQIVQGSQHTTQTAAGHRSDDELSALIQRYRSALGELDPAYRDDAGKQLDLLEAEVAKPHPHRGLVNGLLSSLKSFGTSAVASAGAGAGAGVLAEVVANWPH
jgi:hypothetical protein